MILNVTFYALVIAFGMAIAGLFVVGVIVGG